MKDWEGERTKKLRRRFWGYEAGESNSAMCPVADLVMTALNLPMLQRRQSLICEVTEKISVVS